MKRRFVFLLVLWMVALGAAQTSAPFEPQDYSVFYCLSSSGQPTELERQNPNQTVENGKYVFEITDERSPVRFPAGTPMQFVVRVAEPFEKAKATIQFFSFEPADGKRRTVVKKKDLQKISGNLKMNVEKYGSSSLKLVPADLLAPGEYCFSRSTITQGFCFGIDAAK